MRYNSGMAAWVIFCLTVLSLSLPAVWAAQEEHVEERVIFEVGEITLEGLLWIPSHPPSLGVVLCHPHPLHGGNMFNNVLTTLANALQQAGMATLRFHFRGVGQSGGTHGDGKTEVEDVQGAITYLLNRHTLSTVAVAGYSFGAMVGLRAGAGDARVQALIGVALPLGRRNASFLLTAHKPTLLISGDRDPISPLAALQELVTQLPEPKKLHTIAGADHFFWGQEGEVAKTAVTFLESMRK
jgi:alpha/beta superfamily hydrolase